MYDTTNVWQMYSSPAKERTALRTRRDQTSPPDPPSPLYIGWGKLLLPKTLTGIGKLLLFLSYVALNLILSTGRARPKQHAQKAIKYDQK